jgi:hypothetical protein
MMLTDPIWCDPPMVDLLAAAADTYPPEPLLEHHLPAPDGIVIFAKPLPVVWFDLDTGKRTDQRISAISWCEGQSTAGQAIVGITAWTRGHGLARYDHPKLAIYFPGLRSITHANGLYGADPPDQGGPAGPNRILQAFTALCRTPLVRDETAPGSKAARRDTASAGLADPTDPPRLPPPPRTRPRRTRRRPRRPQRPTRPRPLGPRSMEEPVLPQHRRTPHHMDRRLPPRRLHPRHRPRHQSPHRHRPTR